MTRPSLTALLVVSLGVTGARAASVTASGSAGVVFERNDGGGQGVPGGGDSWDWDLELAGSGTPLRPELLQLQGRGGYRSLESQYQGSTGKTANWNYQLSADLLSEAPLNISLAANRGWSAYNAGSARVGSTLATTELAGAVLHLDGLPMLRASINHSDLATSSASSPTVKNQATTLSLGASQAVGAARYAVAYDTSTSGGDQAQTNYRNHVMTLELSSALGKDAEVHVTERYFLRLPSVEDPTNPRYDDQQFNGGVILFPGQRLNGTINYQYGHSSIVVPQLPGTEVTTQVVSTTGSYQATSNFNLNTTGSLSNGDTQVGDLHRRTTGEIGALSAHLRVPAAKWLTLTLGASGNGGLVQNLGASSTPAYGGGGQVGLSLSQGVVASSITYSGSYQRNGVNLDGHSLDHRLDLTVDADLGRFRLTLGGTASSSQRTDALLGSAQNQSLILTGALGYRQYWFQVTAGDTYGLSTYLTSPNDPNGLLLPTSFNSHTRYVVMSLTSVLDEGELLLTVSGRAAVSRDPDGTQRSESSAETSLRYLLGAFTFVLEDRIAAGGLGAEKHWGNELILGVTRSF